jgi:twinkle protein
MTTLESASTVAKHSISAAARIGLRASKWLLETRGISPETAAQLPVDSATVFFPDCNAKLPAIRFGYSQGWKARSYPEKHFVAGDQVKREFWNLSRVLRSNPETVWIVEGELDVLAMVEAGIPTSAILSTQGALAKPIEGDPNEHSNYAYVREALAAGLSKVTKFVWCGDADTAGRVMRDDMVRLLGRGRFHFVDWPEGIKDAGDMLVKDGAEALLDLVTKGALPWPIVGLYQLSKLPEPPPLSVWMPGFPEWENKVLLAPRTLSAVTGHPGHGKTLMWNQIWFSIVKNYCIPICSFSAETRPRPHVRRQLRTLYHGGVLEVHLDDRQRAEADEWINEMYFWMVPPDNQPTLRWILDTAEDAVIRYGCRIVSIDPWNRLEGAANPGEREDQYILRCLKECYQFATDMNVHFQILAHPAKMEGNRRGTAPMLEDIAGAKHWDNVVDQGFTVHRPKLFEGGIAKTETQFFHRKARFDELGYPCQMNLDFDKKAGKFKSVDYDIR